MKKTFLFSLLVTVVALSIGCGGSGSQTAAPMPDSTPLQAVNSIVGSWREGGARFAVDADGTATLTEEHESIGQISFRDLSDDEWLLDVIDVEYLSNTRANVNTVYRDYEDILFPGMKIVFQMESEREEWFLRGLEITDIPSPAADQELFKVTGTASFADSQDTAGEFPRLALARRTSMDETADDSEETESFILYSTPDASGVFEFEVPAGIYSLAVHSESDYAISNQSEYLEIEVSSDIDLGSIVLVSTEEAYAIAGTVTEKGTSTPVAGALIEAYKHDGDTFVGYAVSSESGYYYIGIEEAGLYYIVINRDYYEPVTKTNISVPEDYVASNLFLTRKNQF